MKQITLPSQEVRFFSPGSPAHTARLFEWNGDLYRAISPSRVQDFKQLFGEGIIPSLIKKGFLVETEPASLRIDGFDFVLKHRRIPFITYAFEWSAPALKDAALLWIELNFELARHGLATIDGHPWNILFDGSKPRFVDVGSLVPLRELNLESVSSEFNGYFLYPCRLMAAEQRRLARSLLRDCVLPITDDEFRFLSGGVAKLGSNFGRGLSKRIRSALPASVKKSLRPVRGRIQKLSEDVRGSKQQRWKKLLDEWRAEISSIDFMPDESSWLEYYEGFADFDNRKGWTAKQSVLDSVLSELRPQTMLDIGSNTGWYSQLAARNGSKVVALETDEPCLDRLYAECKKQDLSVIPLCMNVRNPSSAYGWCGTFYRSAGERLKADCVLALALIHHLVFKQFADFNLIADALAQFTRSKLIVEFISKDDRYVREWWNDGYAWYTLENLLTHLKTRFREVGVVKTIEHRTLILCGR